MIYPGNIGSMVIIELILYFITYTILVIALFLEWLCYKRKMESKESILFTVSLLLLVISVSTSSVLEEKLSSLFTLGSMVLVSVTTFVNTLQERKHLISPVYIGTHKIIGGILFLLLWVPFSIHDYVQWAVVVFLILSVVISMAVMRFTEPRKKYAHLEKANRVFSILFMSLIPVYLIFVYGFGKEYARFPIGFILPLAFILLGVHKIYDDLQRLSVLKKGAHSQEHLFLHYDLTPREKEITALLTKGLSYQTIADQLFISLPTVKTHCSNIYRKCGVQSRYELMILATV